MQYVSLLHDCASFVLRSKTITIIIGSKGSNHDCASFVLRSKTITIIIGSKGSNHDCASFVLRSKTITIIIGSKGSNHDCASHNNYCASRNHDIPKGYNCWISDKNVDTG